MFEVPDVVRQKAFAVGAGRWLEDLPQLVASVEQEWNITVGDAYRHSTEAFVAKAACADGTPAVLKLIVPRSGDAAANEIAVLRLTAGEGCVRLLRSDAGRGALLLEHLGRSLYELALPIGARHEILCSTAARVWRPAPDCGLPTGAEKSRWLVDSITTMWEELDRPCSERAVDYAVTCATRRADAHRDERAVLVHGDVHQWNALEAPDGFKLVDPDGLLAEPEYDLGILMREDPLDISEEDPRERARWLAARTGLDATAVWEWGVVEAVDRLARHECGLATRQPADARRCGPTGRVGSAKPPLPHPCVREVEVGLPPGPVGRAFPPADDRTAVVAQDADEAL